jgi:hypothetical protein
LVPSTAKLQNLYVRRKSLYTLKIHIKEISFFCWFVSSLTVKETTAYLVPYLILLLSPLCPFLIIDLTPVFSGVRVTRSLVLCVCFEDRCLSFFFWPLCCLSFFYLRILITSLWYLQTLLDSKITFYSGVKQYSVLHFVLPVVKGVMKISISMHWYYVHYRQSLCKKFQQRTCDPTLILY